MQARFNSRTAKESLSRERSRAVPRRVPVINPSRSKASAYALTLPGLTPISRASLLMWISPVGWVRNQARTRNPTNFSNSRSIQHIE